MYDHQANEVDKSRLWSAPLRYRSSTVVSRYVVWLPVLECEAWASKAVPLYIHVIIKFIQRKWKWNRRYNNQDCSLSSAASEQFVISPNAGDLVYRVGQ
jgi:hypothetical protein